MELIAADSRLPSQLPNRPCHLTRIGKPAYLPLREDQLPIDLDLEDTVFAFDQARVRSEFVAELSRQPGGAWLVVSNDAIFDGDVHCCS